MNKEVFIAKTYQGLEGILLNELSLLGAQNCTIVNRGVRFEGDFSIMYKANYFCRTAVRILWEIVHFSFRDNNDFYRNLYDVPVGKYLSSNGTLSINSIISESIFKTPLFASQLAKDAICDRYRSLYNERPSVDRDNPDVKFHLYIHRNEASLFLDSSGESLHKRGYKVSNHPAPISEVTAAGMILLSEWKRDCDFIDFMCGSGTFLIEAAMIALNIPAGFYRANFGFFSWLNFDEKLWRQVVESAQIHDDININFYGYDNSPRHLGMAKANIKEADLQDFILLKVSDLKESSPPRSPAFVMINPPYGERLQTEDQEKLYKEIGDTLKQRYAGCTAFIISSDMESLKAIRLHPSKKYTLYNGPLACKMLKYEMYEGEKK